jgi:ribonuclease R
VHGLPDEEKLRAFLDLAAAHGFSVPEAPSDPRALNALLERFHGHAQQRALNQLLLRAMMQAVYAPENIGHYGLGAEHYLHFTSPIRRYPDLIVHRLLKEEWAIRQGHAARRTAHQVLEEIAVLSSERERAAMEAEREIAAFYAALFMKDKVGETFDGVVSAVVEFGIFVELGRWFVEGLVKAEDLGGLFELDPVHHALIDRGTGRAFRVGDKVKVQVASVSPARRQITLQLAGEAAAEVPVPKRGRHRAGERPGGAVQRGAARPASRRAGGSRAAASGKVSTGRRAAPGARGKGKRRGR